MNASIQGTTSSGFSLLEQGLEDIALSRVSLERGEDDSFRLSVDTLDSNASDFDDKSQLFPLLPSGSEWEFAERWRSFWGSPCLIDGSWRFAVGLIKILPHSSRGAYPKAKIYFMNLDFDVLALRLEHLAEEIAPQEASRSEILGSHGAVLDGADDPSRYLDTEARIIKRASEAYREDERLLFRTAVLSEDDVPRFSYINFFRSSSNNDNRLLSYDRTLYGIVPSVYESLSWQTKLQVFLERDLTF